MLLSCRSRDSGKPPQRIAQPVLLYLDRHKRIVMINQNNSESVQGGVAGSRNVIYAHDLSGNLTYLNRQGEQLLGYSCEEARQLNIGQLMAPEISAELRERLFSSTTKRIGSVYVIEVIAKDGRRLALEVSTSIVFRQGGQAEIEGIGVPAVREE